MFYRNSSSVLLRKWHGRLEAFLHNAVVGTPRLSSVTALDRGVSTFTAFAPLMLFLFAIALFLMAVSVGAVHLPVSNGIGLLGLAGITAPARKSGSEPQKPANIRVMEANCKALAKELEAAQEEIAAGGVSQERGEEIEQKAMEFEDLQRQIDQYQRVASLNAKGRESKKIVMPGVDDDGIDRRALYTTPGHLFVLSDEFKKYQQEGKQGWSAKMNLGKRFGKKTMLRGEAARAFEKKAYDAATLPTLGTDAIIPIDRDPELVRYEEPEILSIRDMLNGTTTVSDTIKYVRHILTTRAAATVARGSTKPYLKIEFDTAQVSVETIAVLSKVTEQDIDDAPRLVSYINNEMGLDVKVEEERQLTWGNGTNELSGLFNDPDIPEFNRAQAGDTIIDTIRRMRTDLRKNRVQPTFVGVDPIDWEEVELAKGTDTHYLWGLITDLRGPRIWSLRVVESDAMTNPVTEERRVLMGDGVRGATVYDRQQIQLAVGYVDDDFARNLRTLRAEERLALAVKRPWAFEYFVTSDPTS